MADPKDPGPARRRWAPSAGLMRWWAAVASSEGPSSVARRLCRRRGKVVEPVGADDPAGADDASDRSPPWPSTSRRHRLAVPAGVARRTRAASSARAGPLTRTPQRTRTMRRIAAVRRTGAARLIGIPRRRPGHECPGHGAPVADPRSTALASTALASRALVSRALVSTALISIALVATALVATALVSTALGGHGRECGRRRRVTPVPSIERSSPRPSSAGRSHRILP
jgi:hypothetical protein